jgi:heme exporter protein A
MMTRSTERGFDFGQVTAVGVSRVFGRRYALRKVSLTLRAGEIVGLLGPNGAGKSTLLGVLSTLVSPSSGEVRYGDRLAENGAAALRARLGLLTHELQIYPELTARENLEFFADLYGLDRIPARVEEALTRSALTDRADDVVLGFSRGMRQRLALERALLHDPRLVLLDEPFTGLDEASSRALGERLRGLKADGRIVLLATHDLDLVDGLIDRAVLLRAGRVIELVDTGDTLRERYRTGLQS